MIVSSPRVTGQGSAAQLPIGAVLPEGKQAGFFRDTVFVFSSQKFNYDTS